jgi:hypothetical protein
LLVDPSPSEADAIEFPYTVHFDNMQLEAGEATGGSANTLVDSSRTEIDDYFNGWILTIVSGTGIFETATITDYANGTFTFGGLSGGSTPDSTSVYYVQPASNLHPAGFRFDQVLITACLYQAEQQIIEFDKGYGSKYAQKDLPMAWKTDARSAPRTLGNYFPSPRERNWLDILEYNDIDGNPV